MEVGATLSFAAGPARLRRAHTAGNPAPHFPVKGDAMTKTPDREHVSGTVLVEEIGAGLFRQRLYDGRHELVADEPQAAGGEDDGPSPYGLLLMSLGACTSMTLRLYARRKGLPLEKVAVRLSHDRHHVEDCADCEDKGAKIERIERVIELTGPLSEAQRTRLIEIAELCPVHKTLTGKLKIETRLEE